MSFVERQITISVLLAQSSKMNQPNKFSETNSNTVTFTGSRTKVRIQNSGSPSDCQAQVTVYGLTPSLMNQLSTLGLVYQILPRNIITVTAGDLGATPATVFSGVVQYAYADYSAQPDVGFIFECLSGGYELLAPAAPSSFTGSTSVVTVMEGLARQMNLGFENNQVDVKLQSPYFVGSFRSQADDCARHAGIEWGIVRGNTLAIWPSGSYRQTPNVPVISPETGLVSSPSFTQNGIILKTLFNPDISFAGLVKVRSSVLDGIVGAQTIANPNFRVPQDSTWAVNKLDLALDAQVPKGDWLSIVHAWNPGFPRPLPQPVN